MRRFSIIVLTVLLLTGAVPAFARQEARAKHSARLVSFEGAPIRVVSDRIGSSSAWLKNLAFEVENVGDKPIYFLSIQVSLDGSETYFGAPVVFNFAWGDPRFSSPDETATAADAALMPGERATVTAPESNVRAFYELLRQRGARVPRSVEVLPYIVGTGDQSIWIVGEVLTRETNEARLAEAKLAPGGTNAQRSNCGDPVTTGYYTCPCAAGLPIVGVINSGHGGPKVVKVKTCTYFDENGVGNFCVYNVLRDCGT